MNLLTTGQLAFIFDISKGTIRHYIHEGLLVPIVNEKNGYQQFTERDVYKLYQILFFRKMGLSIEAIRETLDSDSVLSSLKEASYKLDEQIADLQQTKHILGHIIEANQDSDLHELKFDKKEVRYLKEIPSDLLVDNSVDLILAKKRGVSNLELVYFIISLSKEIDMYVLGSETDYDKVLENRTYACQTIEVSDEDQIEREMDRLFREPLFEMSPEKEIIMYEHIYRSLGYRDKSFFNFEIGL